MLRSLIESLEELDLLSDFFQSQYRGLPLELDSHRRIAYENEFPFLTFSRTQFEYRCSFILDESGFTFERLF